MNICNFSISELENYFNNNEVVFLKYRKAFLLEKSNNCGFFFSEIPQATLPNNEIPYSRKGKFYAFKPTDTIIKKYIPTLN